MSGVLFAMQEAFSSDNKTKEEKGDAAPDSASHDGACLAFAADRVRIHYPPSGISPFRDCARDGGSGGRDVLSPTANSAFGGRKQEAVEKG